MNYEVEITKRQPDLINPNLGHIENFRVEEVINFLHGDKNCGSRVNFTYGLFNLSFGSEDFPNIPQEWEKRQEVIEKVGFKEGHVCKVVIPIIDPQEARDEQSRQRILETQGNLAPYPFARWAERFCNFIYGDE